MIENEQTDEEIVTLSLKESKYFAVLVDRYEAKLSRYINRLCNCTYEDIEDLLQEIFIKMYRHLNDFDRNLKFSSWAYRITHNEVISHYRKLNARPATTALLPDFEIKDPQNDDFALRLDKKMNKQKIAHILQQMDVKYREVLILRFYEDKDYAELSDILKKPSGTIATLLNRAKKQFLDKAKQLQVEF